jgi:hypothetical protein
MSLPIRAVALGLLLACLMPRLANADVCAVYNEDECAEHEQCTSCHAFDKVFLCVETTVARKLPDGALPGRFEPQIAARPAISTRRPSHPPP